jgi:beta-mannosidase
MALPAAAAAAAVVALALLGGPAGASALNVTDLGSLQWTLTNSHHNVSVAGTMFPGCVHAHLRGAGVLPQDPRRGFNEQVYRWVALDTWTYTATLVMEQATLEEGAVDLVLENVDTFAELELDGEIVATFSNSFVRSFVPLKPYLHAGENRLRLRFESALAASAAAAASYPYPVPDNSVLIACKSW